MSIASWSATAASNTSVGGVSIAEGCDPSNLNDSDRAIMAGVASAIGTVDLGALSAGSTIRRSSQMSFTGDATVTDARNAVEHLSLTGGAAPVATYNFDYQMDLTHTAGTVDIARGVSSWIRLGYNSASGGGHLNYGFVFAGHVSNEYSGTFDRASVYYVEPVDLADGTGPINYLKAFYCRDQGHTDRIIAEAVAYDTEDFTASTRVSKPTIAHFRSTMTAGTSRYSFLGSGGAQMVHTGPARFGDIVSPTDKLEVNGYAKLTSDGTITTAAGYHEITNHATGFVAVVKSKHASAPNGLQISFSAAAPNNTTQQFLNCADNVATRLAIWSNGNVVNANNSYGAISDIRLKDGVIDAPSVLDKFRKRRFVNYRLRDGDGSTLRGVIAQEEMEISPELVTQGEHLSYNYGGMGVETGQAVTELLAIVDRLSAEVETLKARLQ